MIVSHNKIQFFQSQVNYSGNIKNLIKNPKFPGFFYLKILNHKIYSIILFEF